MQNQKCQADGPATHCCACNTMTSTFLSGKQPELHNLETICPGFPLPTSQTPYNFPKFKTLRELLTGTGTRQCTRSCAVALQGGPDRGCAGSARCATRDKQDLETMALPRHTARTARPRACSMWQTRSVGFAQSKYHPSASQMAQRLIAVDASLRAWLT